MVMTEIKAQGGRKLLFESRNDGSRKFTPISNDPHWGVKVGLSARAYIRTRPNSQSEWPTRYPVSANCVQSKQLGH